MRLRAAALLLSFAGLPAAAQCTWDLPYVPDFDQKRLGALPGDGGKFCVPTSVLNWFAYFSNRGIPQPAGLAGPRNWQSNTNYNVVTANLAAMGVLMGTSTSSGTNGNGGTVGATFYSIGFAQNKIAVQHFWAGNGDPISPQAFAVARQLGGYTAFCYGRYTLDSTSHYTRTGGHCLTLVGEIDACGGLTSTIKFRDPASDGYNTTQSTFTTHERAVTGGAAFFRGDPGDSYDEDVRWQMPGGSSIKFLDSMFVLTPRVALTQNPIVSNQVLVHRAFVLQGDTQPPTQVITLPSGLGPIKGLITHPSRLSHFAAFGRPPTGSPSHLYEIDPVALTATDVLPTGDIRFMDISRFGELYICDGSVLKQYNPRTSPPTLLHQVTLPSVPRVMAWDDSTDTLAFLTPVGATASQFVRYDRNLGTVMAAAPLPGAVNPLGELSLAFARGGEIFLCGDGTASVFRMTQSGNILTPLPTVTLPVGHQPTGLNVDDDDRFLYCSGGLVREYELDPNNRYVQSPVQTFPGMAAGGRMGVLRSRTNHIVGFHDRPGFQDISDPEVLPGTPDCYANCDFSTTPPTLNVLDFACFLNQFAAGQPEANCDGSTTPPTLNVLDFACFLNAFASGCPTN